ncbi:hypothetical protein GOP47_0003810, partial [Adiantum capillus-veneris]
MCSSKARNGGQWEEFQVLIATSLGTPVGMVQHICVACGASHVGSFGALVVTLQLFFDGVFYSLFDGCATQHSMDFPDTIRYEWADTRSSGRLPVEPHKVYRRRQKPAEDIQATDRPPEEEVQYVGASLAPIVEEVAVESPSGDLGQPSQVSDAPSVVPLTADTGHEVEISSSVVCFSSPSQIPLSLSLSDFFFALGPWRYPDSPLRPGPLHVDMVLLVEGSSGDPVFWGTRSQPMVYHLLSSQFDDAIGRLVWSNRQSFWSLPMVFYMEADRQPPTLIRIWDITRAAIQSYRWDVWSSVSGCSAWDRGPATSLQSWLDARFLDADFIAMHFVIHIGMRARISEIDAAIPPNWIRAATTQLAESQSFESALCHFGGDIASYRMRSYTTDGVDINVRDEFPEVLIESQESFSGHTSPISRCRFSAGGGNIASASVDGTVRVLNSDSGSSTSRNATIYCGKEVLSLEWDYKSDRLVQLNKVLRPGMWMQNEWFVTSVLTLHIHERWSSIKSDIHNLILGDSCSRTTTSLVSSSTQRLDYYKR